MNDLCERHRQFVRMLEELYKLRNGNFDPAAGFTFSVTNGDENSDSITFQVSDPTIVQDRIIPGLITGLEDHISIQRKFLNEDKRKIEQALNASEDYEFID